MRSRSVLLLLAVGLLLPGALPAGAGDRRAFSLEDIWRLRRPMDVSVSPDGTKVAFAVRERDPGRGKQNVDLWLLDLAGGEPRRLTFTPDVSETEPRFSPDGKTIAFVAKRGKHPGIWLLPVDGGEARKLVEVPTGVSGILWSPDGKRIAFTSEVWPPCGADMECNRERDERREKNPVRAHLADELLYRHWTHWYDGKVQHVLVAELADGSLRDLTPGDREAPVFSPGAGREYDFSPDGKELAYTRNPDPRETLAWSTNSDVWVVPVEPGPDGKTRPARDVTKDNPAWDGTPRYSPDGRWLAIRTQRVPGYESDRFLLALLDRETGEKRVITEAFDNWVLDEAWLPDSRSLVFTGAWRARVPLFVVSIEGGIPRRAVDHGTIDEFAVLPDGRTVVAARRAADAPPELWKYDLAGKAAPVRLTRVNAAVEEEVDLRPAERHVVKGAEGKEIEVLVFLPHGFDPQRKYPAILDVHGGPQWQWTDSFRNDYQLYPGAGYVLVCPNPHGSTGYGQEFTASISGDWGGRVFEDLMKVADWMESLPFVDRKRIGAMGWSYGGYMMNWFQGNTDRFAAIASMMGVYDLPSKYGATEELWFPEWDLRGRPWDSDLYQKWNPSRLAKNFHTPELLITGEKDYRIAYTQSLQAFTALRRQGIPARLIVYPRSGHWPLWQDMILYYTAHLDWFHRWLGGDPPPWTPEDLVAGNVFDPETGKRRAAEGKEGP